PWLSRRGGLKHTLLSRAHAGAYACGCAGKRVRCVRVSAASAPGQDRSLLAPPRRSHVAWRLGRGGGRGGRWAAGEREWEGERDGCEFGRLGDERHRLDPFRRSGESWHAHGHEQRPGCDLAEAEEPGEERDTWIVWA